MSTRRILRISLVLLLSTAGACTAQSETPTPLSTDTGSPEPVTITLWTYWTGREKAAYDSYLAEFEDQYPWITVNHVGGITDETKVLVAVTAGDPPDVWQWWDANFSVSYCQNDALVDLAPYVERDKLDLGQFNPYWIDYLQVEGKQCALPSLADAFGLYYNRDLFAKAGLQEPPRTFSELTEAAKELTEFNPDGSIKVAGFIPLFDTFYDQLLATFPPVAGASWLTDDTESALASDPDWASLFEWQRDLVDFYGGIDNLQRFVAGLGNNYSPNHAGELGKVAMWMDGEWRVASIEAEHPELNYGTAPFPVADDHPELYGAGLIATNTLQIPQGAQHPDAAWLLIRYLSSDRDFLVAMADEVKNIPPVQTAIQDPLLQSNEAFATFLDIYQNPASAAVPLPALQATADAITGQLDQQWVEGQIADLGDSLASTAAEIDRQLGQVMPLD